jgi:hypothetical protein
MAGAVWRVMNGERVRLLVGVRAFRRVGAQRDPVLDVASGRPGQPPHITHDGRDLVRSTPINSSATPTAADEQ